MFLSTPKKWYVSLIGPLPKMEVVDSNEVILTKKKIEIAQREYLIRWTQYRVGRGTLAIVLDCSRRLRDVQSEVATKPEERLAAVTLFSIKRRQPMMSNETRYENGTLTQQGFLQSKFDLVDAELRSAPRTEKK